ncbi:MAG: DUF1211 domain-containing protein [Thermoplasmata archaeon]|nr:MAG: DUF1211 domain-containing protein [Thermoplasmata archaeon]
MDPSDEGDVNVEINIQADSDSLSPGRIEALTDGVIAIAITLLVLELSIPIISGGGHEGAPSSIGDMWDEFYAYAIGFIALGIYWSFHHYMFHFIKRSDGVLMLLNIMFLSFASMVPFWTAFQVENPDAEQAIAYYGTAMIMTFLTLLAIWIYATWDNRLVSDTMDKEVKMKMVWILGIGSIMVLAFSFGNIYVPGLAWLLFIPMVWFVYWIVIGHQNFKINTPPTIKV